MEEEKLELETVNELPEISLNTNLLKDFKLNNLYGRNRKERREILARIRKANKKRNKNVSK